MGLLGSLLKATIKVAITPLTIIDDGLKVMDGNVPDSTVTNLMSAVNDITDAVDDVL